MKRFVLVGMLTACGACINAQELVQTIRGTVRDKESQSPIIGAQAYVIGSQPPLYAVTNENGEFRIPNVPLGRKQVRFNILGYNERIVTIELNAGKESVLNIDLEEMVIHGEEVEVVATQDKTTSNNKMAQISSRLFSAEEAGRYAGSRNDPARMAANFAGVSGANDSRNDIIIRGNSPLGVLWRLNGVDIPNPNHFGNSGSTGGPVSILNNNTLDYSDFMTAAFPADYANATAGVFDLRMRQGNNEKHEFLLQAGFNGFEVGTEGPMLKSRNASYLFNYRYSTLSVFKALNIDFGTGAAVPQYQDLTFRADYNAGRAGKFTLWGVGGLSYVALLERDKKAGQDLYGFSARDSYFRSNVGVAGAGHTILLGRNDYLKTNLAVSGSYNHIMTDRIDSSFTTPGNLKPEYRQKSGNNRLSFNTTYNRKFNSRNTFNAGIYADLLNTIFVDSNDYQFGNHTFVVLRNYEGTSALLRPFVQLQHRFNDQLQLTAGCTDQYFLLNGTNAIEPRASLRYSFTRSQSFTIGGGLHSQLQPYYIYFATSTQNGIRDETNRNLDFTRAAHAVAAYDVNFKGNFRIKSEIYYQYLYSAPVKAAKDYFSVLNLGADFTSPNITGLVSKGTGYNYGIELTLEKFYSKGYYFLVTTSLFESKYRGGDGILRNTAFNGNYVHNMLAGKEFRIGKRHIIVLDARATWAGGKRYIPVDIEASNAAGVEIRDVSQAYSRQYPDYFRMDVKPGYKFNKRKITHEVSVDFQNVTRHLNVFQESYDLLRKELKRDYQLKFFVIPQYRITF